MVRLSQLINIVLSLTVLVLVPSALGGVNMPVKVKRICPAGIADVYNMEVAQHHNFCIANGLVVHNCTDSLRYLTMSLGLFSGVLEAVTTGVGREDK